MDGTMYYVYILRCADDSLYIGYARDPIARVEAHNNGRGAAYTFKRRPVELAYVESHATKTAAIRRDSLPNLLEVGYLVRF